MSTGAGRILIPLAMIFLGLAFYLIDLKLDTSSGDKGTAALTLSPSWQNPRAISGGGNKADETGAGIRREIEYAEAKVKDEQDDALTDHARRTMKMTTAGPLEDAIRDFQAAWEVTQPKSVQISPFSTKASKEFDPVHDKK